MNVVDRRQFLGLTLSAAAFSAASNLLPFDDRYAHGKVLGADGMPVSPQVEGPETMFLTWPGDPTSTICIQWVDQDHGNELEIAYSPLESDNWQIAKVTTKPFPMTKDKVYRASISSLQPGTEYRFRMGADAPTFRFRTMPKKLTDTFHFVSGGDAGTGSHAIGTNQLAARQEPYFALLAGDLAYDNGKSPRTFIKFLKNYRAHMVDPQGRLIPLLACPGNHEVDGAYKQPREKAGSYLSVFDCFFRIRPTVSTISVMTSALYCSIPIIFRPSKGNRRHGSKKHWPHDKTKTSLCGQSCPRLSIVSSCQYRQR